MDNYGQVVTGRESALATNKVLRNTYILLSMSLIFSAVMAAVSMAVGVSQGAALISMIAAIVLVWFVLPKFENSVGDIAVVFAFTGLMGLSIGPMLAYYLGRAIQAPWRWRICCGRPISPASISARAWTCDVIKAYVSPTRSRTPAWRAATRVAASTFPSESAVANTPRPLACSK